MAGNANGGGGPKPPGFGVPPPPKLRAVPTAAAPSSTAAAPSSAAEKNDNVAKSKTTMDVPSSAERSAARPKKRPVTRSSRLGLDASEPTERRERVRLAPRQIIPGTRYRLSRWLGDGGMGVVYEAIHVDLDRKAALKILRPNLTSNESATRSFREEAKAVNRVGSRNVVEIFDFAELPDGRLLFAMELLDGPTISELVDDDGRIPVERAIPILRQLCRGMAAVHDAGIVHRDVKPQNVVLVDEEGRSDMVKILDFGIATMLVEGQGSSTAAGTVVYMAPEQIEGRPADPRMDMYSLGCTAYEMLTGSPPFLPDSLEELIDMQRHADPPSMQSLVPELPGQLEAVIMRCLAKRPDERYADMRDLEAALCEAQLVLGIGTAWDDLPIPAVEPERKAAIQSGYDRMRVPEQKRRPRWQWLAAGALGLSIAVSGGIYIGMNTEVPVEARNTVENLTFAARTAASQAYFVYPPAEEPEKPTAYTQVLALEQLGGDAHELGQSRARSLRSEFGSTLVRLGDEYWDKPGGETFALDYYAQALVFEPSNERARDRASLTPGELASLRKKAGSGEFSDRELEAAEPLIALAEPDVTERVEKLRKLHKRKRRRSAVSEERLAAILEGEIERTTGVAVAVKKRPKKAVDQPTDPRTGSNQTAPVEADSPEVADPVGIPTGSKRPEERDTRDPAQAKVLASQGKKALAKRKYSAAETLFSRALSHDNRNTAALVGLSDAHFERGAYQKAVGFAKRAVSLAPRNAQYRIRLGDAYFKVHRYGDARGQYVKARELGHKQARKRVAMVDKKLGQ